MRKICSDNRDHYTLQLDYNSTLFEDVPQPSVGGAR